MKKGVPEQDQLIDKISEFVEGIRFESSRKRGRNSPPDAVASTSQKRSQQDDLRRVERRDSTPDDMRDNNGAAQQREDEEERARRLADKLVVESEQFKANLIAPKGMPSQIDNHIQLLRKFDNDDDFFHTTCHIEPGVKSKIEMGEFIE